MKKSYLIAGSLTAGLTLWMASSLLTSDAQKTKPENAKIPTETPLTTVQVELVQAEPVVLYVSAHGSVEPERRVVVRAETTGKVAAVVARKGDPVKAGDLVVRLDLKEREARVKTATARVADRQAAYDAAQTLSRQGHSTKRNVDELYAQLQSARAELEQANIEIGHTEVRAPFAGILNERKVEVGDYVPINGEIATIVDADPLLVHVQVAQHEISKIKIGAVADVELATGQEIAGKVRYISSDADQDTRTFRVEIEVANTDNSIPSGISAAARIHAGSTNAHPISPAILSLNDDGQVGIKAVGAGDQVAFYPVEIVKSSHNGIWVTGLPTKARVITVGHGFVRVGQKVAFMTQSGVQKHILSDRLATRNAKDTAALK